MSTICSMASSCPTIILRRVRSRDSASRPVFVGSKAWWSRLVVLSSFLLPAGTVLSKPNSKVVSGNFLACFIVKSPRFMNDCLSFAHRGSFSRWFCGSHFHTAYQGAPRLSQNVQHDIRNILRRYLPPRFFLPGVAAKLCVDAAWHDVADLHIVVAMVEHERFSHSVQSKLRGVVG